MIGDFETGDFQLIDRAPRKGQLCSFFSAVASVASAGIQASAAKKAAGLQADAAADSLDLQREVFETSRRDLAPFSQVGFGALNELSRIFLGTDSPTALQNAANGGQAPDPFDASTLNLEREGLLRQLEQAAAPRIEGESFNELGRPSFAAQQNATADGFDVSGINQRIAAIDQEIAKGNAGPTEFGTFTPGQLSQEQRQSNFFTSPSFLFRQDEGEKAIERALAARGLSTSGQLFKGLAEFNSNLASTEFGNFTNSLAQLAGLGQKSTAQGVNLAQNFAGNAGQTLLDAGTARASGVAGQANALSGGIKNLSNIFEGRDVRNFFGGGSSFSNPSIGNVAGTGRAGAVGTPGVGGGFFSSPATVGGGASRLAVF